MLEMLYAAINWVFLALFMMIFGVISAISAAITYGVMGIVWLVYKCTPKFVLKFLWRRIVATCNYWMHLGDSFTELIRALGRGIEENAHFFAYVVFFLLPLGVLCLLFILILHWFFN